MHPRNSPIAVDWHVNALHHVLLRHNIQLDERRTHEIAYLQETINRLPTTAFDHLEVLRIFDLALSKRTPFMLGIGKQAKALSTIDLFYSSLIVGLKSHNETYSGITDLKEIVSHLPQKSFYNGDLTDAIALASALERVFLQGLAWRIQASPQQAREDYLKLLRPLDKESLNAFSAAYLYIASTGAGDPQDFHDMLCQLNPAIRKKSSSVIQALKSLPLKERFIDDNACQTFIQNDMIDFLGRNSDHFELSEKTMDVIRCTLLDDFIKSTKPITNPQMKGLEHYFTPKQIDSIVAKQAITRLDDLHPTLRQTDACKRLIQDLLGNQVDLAWLIPNLNTIENLGRKRLLNGWLLTTLLSARGNTAISKHVLALESEGWLKVMSDRRELQAMVAGLLTHHQHADDLTPDLSNLITTYFIKHKPGLVFIKQLKEGAKSEISKNLVDALTSHYQSNMIKKLTKKILSSSAYHAHIFYEFEIYYKQHRDERLALLDALTIINDEHFHHGKSPLLIFLLAHPPLLRFGARLALRLKHAFEYHQLSNIERQMPTIYIRMLKSIMKDPDALKDIEAYFKITDGITRDSGFVYNSLESVKPHIHSAIETARANGRIRLNSQENAALTAFYRDAGITAPLSKPKTSHMNRFFSPEKVSEKPVEEATSEARSAKVLSV